MYEVNAVCAIVVRRGCPHCHRVLTLIRQRFRWAREHLPIIDLEDLRRYFPELYRILVKCEIDEYGDFHEYAVTPAVVCLDMEQPIPLTGSDDEIIDILETIRSRYYTTTTVVGFRQKYRAREPRGRRGQEG